MEKGRMVLTTLFCYFIILFFSGSGAHFRKENSRSGIITILENNNIDLNIKEGYVCKEQDTVRVLCKGEQVAEVILSEPIMVAQADKKETWGYFQFPGMCRTDDGKLIVSWMMNEDSFKAYGKGSCEKMMSSDEGESWVPLDKDYFVRGFLSFDLKNGDVIQIHNQISKDINRYSSFPVPICSDSSINMHFYLEKDLPDDLRGTYLIIRNGQTGQFKRVKGVLDDNGLMRYSIDDYMPLIWWGQVRELQDGNLVGGIYGTYYLNLDDETPKSCISFYESSDYGCNWKAVGKIPYRITELKDEARQYDKTRGFSESYFVILEDSTFFCVSRTGSNTPMYKIYSYDKGRHWTNPEAFTPNGVCPQLLQLDNGIMVMSSGRPGVQLRFCIDGDGNNWTEPIEMLPYMKENGYYDIWGVSCGYSRLLKVDEHTFYIVYSDFKTKNTKGELRKAIMFRKIMVNKRSRYFE